MKKIIIYSLIISILGVSCSEDTLDVPNENSYDETFFNNPQAYEEATTAIYNALLHPGMYAREYYYIFDLLGNDAKKNFPLQGGLLEFPEYTHTPNSVEITEFFTSSYKLIFRANFVLDLMSDWQPSIDQDVALKKRITGEALFLKSLANFWLVNSFGDIPLKKTIEDHGIVHSPRDSKEDVWAAINEDLQMAIDLLPVNYQSDDDYGRATRGAALALLGKSYLYQNKYPEAIIEFNKLRTAPYSYSLTNSLDDIFINDQQTSETMFAVIHARWQGAGVSNPNYMFDGQELWGGQATHTGRGSEYGFNDWWNVLVSDPLVEAFSYLDESNNMIIDPRAALTYYDNGSKGGDTQFLSNTAVPKNYTRPQVSWRKYQQYENIEREGNPSSPINSQVIRYADVLLMLAEAYIESGQISNALPLINSIRSRSGAFTYTNLGNQEEARQKLRLERRLELAGEQSRYFDLVRWGILVETINEEKEYNNVKDYHMLLPIPQGERDSNPVLDAQINNNWN